VAFLTAFGPAKSLAFARLLIHRLSSKAAPVGPCGFSLSECGGRCEE